MFVSVFVCLLLLLFVCFSVGFDFLVFIYVSLLFWVCGVCVCFLGGGGSFFSFCVFYCVLVFERGVVAVCLLVFVLFCIYCFVLLIFWSEESTGRL